MPEPDRQLLKEKTSKHDVYRANSGDGDCSWMSRLNKSAIETFRLLEARRLFFLHRSPKKLKSDDRFCFSGPGLWPKV
jgi:hypothetical protein